MMSDEQTKILLDNEFDYSIHYRHWHDDSDAHARIMIDSEIALLKLLDKSDKRLPVLDIGCAMGFTMRALLELGFNEVEGVDIDSAQVDACLRQNLAVRLCKDIVSDLKSRPQRYGAVLMLDVLEHIPVNQQIGILRAVFRAMAPGAMLILKVPNANSLCSARWRYIDFTHFTSYTEISLKFVLKNAGFEDFSIPNFERPKMPRLPRIWRRSYWRAWRFYLVRSIWAQVLIAEFGDEAKSFCLDLNLIATARRGA
jgi:2-polyprenyl-3-methyl-5-hydroxy-6-metoxy-1,4-benzoquinol methylase